MRSAPSPFASLPLPDAGRAARRLDERGARRLADLQRPGQVEQRVDQRLGLHRALRRDAVGDRPHARRRRVADVLDGEVDPLHQRAAVDPFLAGVPALDAGRVHQLLTHRRHLGVDVDQVRRRFIVQLFGQLEDPRDEFRRALHALEARRLEEVGIEQHAHHLAHVGVAVAERPRQRLDRRRVARFLHAPGRHLRLVGDEEVVQVPRDEARRALLPHDLVDDVLALQPARHAQELLLAVVVVLRPVEERRVVAAVGIQRDRLPEGPAGEGVGRVLDVGLAVVADPHREEFQQLAAVVLVRGVAVVLAVVQPEDHGRVLRELQQQRAEVAQPLPPQHVDVRLDRRPVLQLEPSRREDVMPEQRHLLLQRARRRRHAVDPAGDPGDGRLGRDQRREVAAQEVVGRLRRAIGVQQLLDDVGVGPRGVGLQFPPRRSQAGPAQQMRRLGQACVSHGGGRDGGLPSAWWRPAGW